MKCPECDGLKMIHLPATETHQRYDIICPTCEGTGELLDTPVVNWCPACGEPIQDDEKWCKFHSLAENFQFPD